MIGLLPISVALLLGLCLPFVLLLLLPKHVSVKQNQPADLPPGSMGWLFCGETLGFLKPHKSNSVGIFLQDHFSRYGRIFKSHLFGSPTIVSCDLELNLFILQNEEKLFQCSYPKPIHGILGNSSLLTVSGSLHKRLRSLAIGFIGASKSKPDFLDYVEKQSVLMMKSWEERQEVVFYREAKMFAFTLIVKNIMSIEAEDPVASKVLEDFLTFMKGFVSLPLRIPGTPFAKAVKARERISRTIREIISEREEQRSQRLYGEADFLDVILSRGGLSDDEKVSLVLDLLLGGYETTATLMALVLYFLGNSPPALQQLKEEHQVIRKRKEEGEPLNWEDYKQMKFTQSVICEALRCGNVVKFVHRKAIRDVKFKGYLIPSGWKVLPVFTAVHLDPSLHDNPTEFNPWRWTDQATSKKVIPFSGGPRLCPGAELARVEIAFFLHYLVLSYRWKPKGGDFPLAFPYVEFKRGLVLEIEPTDRDMEG